MWFKTYGRCIIMHYKWTIYLQNEKVSICEQWARSVLSWPHHCKVWDINNMLFMETLITCYLCLRSLQLYFKILNLHHAHYHCNWSLQWNFKIFNFHHAHYHLPNDLPSPVPHAFFIWKTPLIWKARRCI